MHAESLISESEACRAFLSAFADESSCKAGAPTLQQRLLGMMNRIAHFAIRVILSFI